MAAAVNFDQIRILRALKRVKIGRGQADISAVEPGMARFQAEEGDIFEGVFDSGTDNPETVRRGAASNLIQNHAGNRPRICRSEPFL